MCVWVMGCCRSWEPGQAGNSENLPPVKPSSHLLPPSHPLCPSSLEGLASTSDLPQHTGSFPHQALKVSCPRTVHWLSVRVSHFNWREKMADPWSTPRLFFWKSLTRPHVQNAESQNSALEGNWPTALTYHPARMCLPVLSVWWPLQHCLGTSSEGELPPFPDT